MNRWFGMLALLCVAWSIAGCKSTPPPSAEGALAWVEIRDREAIEIARAVSDAFQKDGYKPVPLPRNPDLRLKFEKPASSGTSILYSDWSFKRIWLRAQVELKRLDTNTFMVTCNAFRVNEKGDPHFEEEDRITAMGRGPYQDLLNAVRDQLNPPPARK